MMHSTQQISRWQRHREDAKKRQKENREKPEFLWSLDTMSSIVMARVVCNCAMHQDSCVIFAFTARMHGNGKTKNHKKDFGRSRWWNCENFLSNQWSVEATKWSVYVCNVLFPSVCMNASLFSLPKAWTLSEKWTFIIHEKLNGTESKRRHRRRQRWRRRWPQIYSS